MKLLQSFIKRLLQSDDFLAQGNGREVHEVGGLMRLLHSFTKRLLQSDDFLAREGGGKVVRVRGRMGVVRVRVVGC